MVSCGASGCTDRADLIFIIVTIIIVTIIGYHNNVIITILRHISSGNQSDPRHFSKVSR